MTDDPQNATITRDCYGCVRDDRGHLAFPVDDLSKPLDCTGALVLGEIRGLKVPVMGLEAVDYSSGPDGQDRPTNYVVTSPNMDWIPDLAQDNHWVWNRTDGRCFVHDFTLFPQWYFPGTYYLPFIRSRPDKTELPNHPYQLAWYDLQQKDFNPEIWNPEIGLITSQLANSFIKMSGQLSRKARELQAIRTESEGHIFRDLQHAVRGMRMLSSMLTFAPQPWLMTLLTVTKFQRYCLETLAIVEYMSVWQEIRLITFDEPRQVDRSLIGAVTADVTVAHDLYTIGVPVWLVRPPSRVSPGTRVCNYVFPSLPSPMSKVIFPGSSRIIDAPPSALRNRVCQVLNNVRINLGHSSLEQQAADPHQPIQPASFLPQLSSVSRPDAATIQGSSASLPSSSKTQSHIQPSGPAQDLNYDLNEARFLKMDLAVSPSACQPWWIALSSIKHPSKQVQLKMNKFTQLMRGFAMPDPLIFNRESHHLHLVGWLMVRATWISQMSQTLDRSQGYPRPQNWKSFLAQIALSPSKKQHAIAASGADPSSSTTVVGSKRPLSPDLLETADSKKAKTKGRKAKNHKGKQYGAPLFKFAERLNLSASADVHWNGLVALPASSLIAGQFEVKGEIVKEVLWDALENNFRLELLALDRSLITCEGDEEAQEARQYLVSKVFPGGSAIVSYSVRAQDIGLGARGWQDRAEYIAAFQDLLLDWPGVDKSKVSTLSAGDWEGPRFIGNEKGVLELEAILYPFYCQTFFDYFGRAPTIPYHIPTSILLRIPW